MLIVSCQAEGNSPFNKSEYLYLFAKCAELEGITLLRTEGIDNVKYLSEHVKSNIIGLVKSTYENGLVKITREEKDIKELLKYTNTIAIDGTFRRYNGYTGPEFIKHIKEKYNCYVIADVSNCKEAIECYKYTDYISTALSGYTTHRTPKSPNYKLIKEIHSKLPNAVLIAEGRYNTPKEAARAVELGATHVCVGSAITRPQNIIKWYNNEINKVNK